MHGGHAVQVLIDGAHQHLAPEAVDGARRLALLQQPVEHADAVQVLAARAFAAQGQQARARCPFVARGPGSCMPQKRPGEMQRRGQPAAAQHGNAPARLDEVELAVEPDAVAHAQALVEIQQVDAAAQQDVLAVVDGLFPHRVGGGAPAQERPRLEQVHLEIPRRPARPPPTTRRDRRRRSERWAFKPTVWQDRGPGAKSGCVCVGQAPPRPEGLFVSQHFRRRDAGGVAGRVDGRQEAHQDGRGGDPDAVVGPRLEGHEAQRVDRSRRAAPSGTCRRNSRACSPRPARWRCRRRRSARLAA